MSGWWRSCGASTASCWCRTVRTRSAATSSLAPLHLRAHFLRQAIVGILPPELGERLVGLVVPALAAQIGDALQPLLGRGARERLVARFLALHLGEHSRLRLAGARNSLRWCRGRGLPRGLQRRCIS